MFKYLAAAKLLRKQKARVDNVMFHLHYRVTFIVFVVSSALITAKEYFGTPINCYAYKYPIPKNVLNTYCFIMSTFSVMKHNETNEKVVYRGVGPHVEGDELVYHSYYQWVPVVLFLQAISFYLPRFMWKSFEGGLFSSILQGLDKRSLDDGGKTKKYRILLKYMMSHVNMHRNWAIRFFVCELLCMVNVIANLYATDAFLGGSFMNYGSKVFSMVGEESIGRDDPMDIIFPRVAKCTFKKFGTSGTVETHDSMCVLPINILNVKIYIFLWYWMIGLTAVTALWLVYRILIILFGTLRGYLLTWRGRLAGRAVVDKVGARSSLGDWFLLYHLGRCMHPCDFAAFLREFADQLTVAEGEGSPSGGQPQPSAPSMEAKPMMAN